MGRDMAASDECLVENFLGVSMVQKNGINKFNLWNIPGKFELYCEWKRFS